MGSTLQIYISSFRYVRKDLEMVQNHREEVKEFTFSMWPEPDFLNVSV